MGNGDLPTERVYSRGWSEKGQQSVLKIEAMPIQDEEFIKLVFESKNSPWRQGVWLKTDGALIVNDQECPSVSLWEDSAPTEVLIECHTSNNCLHFYNIWDNGTGRQSQSWSSGMRVEDTPNGRRYFCTDVGFETNFDKLVFRIERTSAVDSSDCSRRSDAAGK